jgi:hypothetical protein
MVLELEWEVLLVVLGQYRVLCLALLAVLELLLLLALEIRVLAEEFPLHNHQINQIGDFKQCNALLASSISVSFLHVQPTANPKKANQDQRRI